MQVGPAATLNRELSAGAAQSVQFANLPFQPALTNQSADRPGNKATAVDCRPDFNGRPSLPALIEGSIPLPGLALLRSKSYLAQLYDGRHLSARQIARLTEVSRSTAFAALKRCNIPKNGRNRTHPGQLPFGYDYQNYRLVKNQAEQGVIRLIRQGRAGGLSLRQIAGQLNQRLILSKDGGSWQANTVRLILARA